MVHFVLLSGGGGTRLWPLSTDRHPKQFLKLFDSGCGTRESLLQRAYRLVSLIAKGSITVATADVYGCLVHNQLGEHVDLCVEPCRRDTFPAIALAVLRLRDVFGADPSDGVVVCPTDHLADGDYYRSALDAGEFAEKSESLVLMGIRPERVSTQYGYILPDERDPSRVVGFLEKPEQEVARHLLERGAMWNAGVFAFPLGMIIARTESMTGITSYSEMLSVYESLESVSFDYAVSERERDIRLVRYGGTWSDVGSWGALSEALNDPTIGDVRFGPTTKGLAAINTTDAPLIIDGISDSIIVSTEEGTLVISKRSSMDMKHML